MDLTSLTVSLCLAAGLGTAAPLARAAPDATQLLKDAEAIRNPHESYKAESVLTDDPGSGRPIEVRTYEIAVKTGQKTLVTYLTPEVDRGTKVLMVDNDMYVAVPASAKPLKIAPRQKLAGNAAYGDVARLNYDDNYDAKLIGEKAFEDREVYALDLVPKPGREVTYDRIEYWVEKSNHRPVKAFYQTESGKVLREAVFTNWQDVLGVQRPLTMVLFDALNSKLKTTIELKRMRKANLPEAMFERQHLK